jgi:hypothetical protein
MASPFLFSLAPEELAIRNCEEVTIGNGGRVFCNSLFSLEEHFQKVYTWFTLSMST